MQKNMLLLTMLCAVSMSGVMLAMNSDGEETGDSPKNENLVDGRVGAMWESHHSNTVDASSFVVNIGTKKDPVLKPMQNALKDAQTYVDTQIEGVEKSLDIVKASTSSRFRKVEEVLYLRKFDFKKFISQIPAATMATTALISGMRFPIPALTTPAWGYAAALGNSVAAGLSNVPYAGGALKVAATAGGIAATGVAGIVTSYSVAFTGAAFVLKCLYDVRKIYNDEKVACMRAYKQHLQDQLAKYCLENKINENEKENAEKYKKATAKFSVTDRGYYLYAAQSIVSQNFWATLKVAPKVIVTGAAFILSGMLVAKANATAK